MEIFDRAEQEIGLLLFARQGREARQDALVRRQPRRPVGIRRRAADRGLREIGVMDGDVRVFPNDWFLQRAAL